MNTKSTKKVCTGPITSPFGVRRDPLMPTTWRQHNGVDIGAPVGTPVFSPIEGVVMGYFRHSIGGNTLILADNEGVRRVGMCHLSGCYVREGEFVKKGQRVALVGQTGRCTGPHLHLSLKTGGKWSHEFKEYIGGNWADPTPLIEFIEEE